MSLRTIEWAKWYGNWGLTVRSLEKAYAPSRLLDLLASRLPRSPGALALELGCAPGRWTEWARTRIGLNTIGLELNAAGAQLTHHLFPAIPVMRADAQAIPVRDRSFDAVFSVGLIEHFDEPERLLAEMFRSLKPSGICIVVVPNLDAGSFQRWHWQLSQPAFLAAHRMYSLSGLAEEVRKAGFEIVDQQHNGLYIPHMQRVMARLPLRGLLRRLEGPTVAANLVVIGRRRPE